jgi:dynein heavy chain
LEYDDPWEELQEYNDTQMTELEDIVEKVRGDLPSDTRKMINALITQDVHYRDIVSDLLMQENLSPDEFKWQQ